MKKATLTLTLIAALLASTGTAYAADYQTDNGNTVTKCPRGSRGGAIASIVVGSVFGLGLVGIPLITSGSVKLSRHNKAKKANACDYSARASR